MRPIISIIAIIVLVFLAVLIFGGGSSNNNPQVVTTHLSDYANTDVEVRLTVDGQINNNEAHRQIIFTVGRDNRSLQVNKGYQGEVLKSESFDNNKDAYNAFLRALDTSGFTLSRKSKFPNEQGLCPLGQRYIYEVINNGNKNTRTWSTSCNGPSNFKGKAGLVQELFHNQIGNYDEYVNNVEL